MSFSLFLRQEQKKQEKLIFEKELEVKQREQAKLLLLNNSHKEDILLSVKQVTMPTGNSINTEHISRHYKFVLLVVLKRTTDNAAK